MRSQSLKAKGRRWQQEVAFELKKIFPHLDGNDVLSRPMGSQGSDLILSPLAQIVLPYDFEMKNQEKSKIWEDLRQSEVRLETQYMYPILMLKHNHMPKNMKSGIAILPFGHFCSLLMQHVNTIPIDHMMSARAVIEMMYGHNMPPMNITEMFYQALVDLTTVMTGYTTRVSNYTLHIDGHESIRIYHGKTMNIYAEFTGQPMVFNRDDPDHVIYIAITASTFYRLLSKIK